MSRLLTFEFDGSTWCFETLLKCEWSPSKVMFKWHRESIDLPSDDPFQEHQYTVLYINGRRVEIDSVLSKCTTQGAHLIGVFK